MGLSDPGQTHVLQTGDGPVRLDEHGHLVNAGDWTEAVANALAQRDAVLLDDGHWWLIRFVREYHLRYDNPPLMRTLVAELKAAGRSGDGSRYLYRLFPDGPVRLACKYGGLPKPDWCL